MKKLFAIAFAGLLFSSCASIISGGQQTITVTSNVEGADVYIVNLKKSENTLLGKTPFTGLAPRLSQAKLLVKKEGYKDTEVAIETSTNMVFLGNILIGGTTGTSTDFSTGAIYKYSKSSYLANLEPAGKTTTEMNKFKKESEIRVFAVMNFDRLTTDISAGKGEYLDSLYKMYGATSTSEKSRVYNFVKESQLTSASIPDFAAKLVSKM